MVENITRAEYLNALELIDNYHRQEDKLDIISSGNKSLRRCKAGDFVICKHVNQQSMSCLTKDKIYEVVSTGEAIEGKIFVFYIIDDNGKKKKHSVDSAQFKALY